MSSFVITLLKKIKNYKTLKKTILFFLPRRFWHLRRFDLDLQQDFESWEQLSSLPKKHIIIGSGSSTSLILSSSLDNSLVFFLNGSIRLLKNLKERKFKSVYVSTDPNYVKNSKEIFLFGLNESDICYFSYEVLEYLKKKNIDLKGKIIYPIDLVSAPYWSIRRVKKDFDGIHLNQRVGFSFEPQKFCYSGETVAFSALQISLWLRPKSIEFYGLDFNNGGKRFYKENEALPSRLETNFEKIILPSFQIAKKILDKEKVSYKNYSPENKILF